MKTKSLLVSLPGRNFDLRSLFPNQRLAGVAGGLVDAGHETRVVDYCTVDSFDRLFPSGFSAVTRPLADRLFTCRESTALETVTALWRLRGLKGAVRERRRDFVSDVVSELASVDDADFILFDVARPEEFSMTQAVASGVRAMNRRVRLIASGPFIQGYAPLLGSLKGFFDCYCLRDAERTVPEWAERLSHAEKWKSVRNLLVDGASSSPDGCSGSLNTIPAPIYGDGVYPAVDEGGKLRLFSVECSRGCSRKCPHCAEPAAEGGVVQIKSARRVCEEVGSIYRANRSGVFRFSGSIACANYAASVAYEILSRGLNIQYCRAGTITGMNSIIFSALKASGCQALAFRVDTGSQWMLDDYYKRGFSVTATENVLRASKECKVYTVVQLTYPSPADDYHSKEESLRLLDRTRPDSAIVALPEVLPGSEWYAQSRGYGFELDPGKYLRQLCEGESGSGLPLRVWYNTRYGGRARNLLKAYDERESLIREIEGIPVASGITAETALVSRVCGYEGHEHDFNALVGRNLFTGDAAGVATIVNRFNEKASIRSGIAPLSYGAYLAAVGN